MPQIETTPEFVEAVYANLERNLEIVRERLRRPLTYAEKILLGHLDDAKGQELDPGECLELRPLSFTELDALIRAGRLTDAKTLCTLLYLPKYLERAALAPLTKKILDS